MNLDQELKFIGDELEKMFSLTREFLRRSLVYYLSDGSERFDARIDDAMVNACERNVEAWCLSILLREKVYAADPTSRMPRRSSSPWAPPRASTGR